MNFAAFPQKSAAFSATGFTQKRHTLYVYYSGFGGKFQMFFDGFPVGSLYAAKFSLDSISIVEFIIEARSNAKKDASQWKRT